MHRVEPETELRSRRLYRTTPEGEQALREWVKGGRFEPAVTKNTTLLRTLYGHVVERHELAERVDEHVAWAQEQLERLEVTLAATEEPLRRLVLEWAIERAHGELAASRRLSETLHG